MTEKDERPWVKLSIDYFDNPKIDVLSDTAQLLHLQLIVRAARLKSDGKVSRRAVRARGEAAFKELESQNLIEKLDPKTYQIHDYMKHQTASEDVQRISAERAAAGARGGHIKNHERRYLFDINCHFCRDDADKGAEWVSAPGTKAKYA